VSTVPLSVPGDCNEEPVLAHGAAIGSSFLISGLNCLSSGGVRSQLNYSMPIMLDATRLESATLVSFSEDGSSLRDGHRSGFSRVCSSPLDLRNLRRRYC